ncbi:MAG: hypothetical protein CR982_08080 [Candidatus Cloacimonadota bacterium]|nr:MAG: hypothetical protein CR982_08080 [Candidatus Cloacimonadota bacterium]PIE77636.1 MAG: hypothetical protein CSA15_11980 [Candidatus Delongbacteria bacterium]
MTRLLIFITIFSFLFSCDIFERVETLEILDIKTYDGSGQAVHPDIFTEDNKIYLAFTPFKYSDNKLENPSLLISSNGEDFHGIEGLSNPIVPPLSGKGYNNDPDIFKKGDKYCIIYNETYIGNYQLLNLLESKDLVNWSKSTIDTINLKLENIKVSPAFAKNDSLFLFEVEASEKNRVVYRNIKNSFSLSPYSEAIFNRDLDFEPWHIDVIEGSSYHYMIISGISIDFNYQDLYIARSEDLKHWEIASNPILEANCLMDNSRKLYRSSGYFEKGSLHLYISLETYDNEWLIAYKEIKDYDNFFK